MGLIFVLHNNGTVSVYNRDLKNSEDGLIFKLSDTERSAESTPVDFFLRPPVANDEKPEEEGISSQEMNRKMKVQKIAQFMHEKKLKP